MGEKREKEVKTEKKVVAATAGKDAPATLGAAAGLVTTAQMEALQKQLDEALAENRKLSIQIGAMQPLLNTKDALIAVRDGALAESKNLQDLAIKETCDTKSKLVVANRLIENLKKTIEDLKLDVLKQKDKTKSVTARALDYRKESAKLHERLVAEGITMGPLSEEPVPDEEDAVEGTA